MIVSVRRGANPWGADPNLEYVTDAYVWDGESYIDQFFCKDRCAVNFTYAMLNSERYRSLGADGWRRAIQKRLADKGAGL